MQRASLRPVPDRAARKHDEARRQPREVTRAILGPLFFVCERTANLARVSSSQAWSVATLKLLRTFASLRAEFGELLGPLAPAELLQRPLFSQFCQYLAAELGPFPTDAETPHQETRSKPQAKSISARRSCSAARREEEDPMVSLAYQAAAAGALSAFECESGGPEGFFFPSQSSFDPVGPLDNSGLAGQGAFPCCELFSGVRTEATSAESTRTDAGLRQHQRLRAPLGAALPSCTPPSRRFTAPVRRLW